jgi:hypothetical protein
MEKAVNHGLIIRLLQCLISGQQRINGGRIGRRNLLSGDSRLIQSRCGRLVKSQVGSPRGGRCTVYRSRGESALSAFHVDREFYHTSEDLFWIDCI